MLYLFAPRENKTSIVVLAQKLDEAKALCIDVTHSDGINNIGVDRQLTTGFTYFRKKALEVLHDYLQVPVLLEYPNNHPSLTDSDMSEFGYIGAFRFEIHEKLSSETSTSYPSPVEGLLYSTMHNLRSQIFLQQDYSQMEYIFVCYLYEGHSVEPLLSFAFEKLHPSYLPSLQMRDEKQIFEIGLTGFYDIGVFRDRCITLAHLYLHNFNKENVHLPSSQDSRYIWTQFFTNNLQSGNISRRKVRNPQKKYAKTYSIQQRINLKVLHQEIEKL